MPAVVATNSQLYPCEELKFWRRPVALPLVSELRESVKSDPKLAVIFKLPLTLSRSQLVPAVPVVLLISKLKVAPPAKVVLPTVSRPGLLPGEMKPPEPTRRLPVMVPEPPRVPPDPMVT